MSSVPDPVVVEVSAVVDRALEMGGVLEVDVDPEMEVVRTTREMVNDGGMWTEVEW